jgi:hypothetical protein
LTVVELLKWNLEREAGKRCAACQSETCVFLIC